MAQFFLSRSAGDDDSYALRFFRDLSARVSAFSDSVEVSGFVDTSHRASAEGRSPWMAGTWTAGTWNALVTCQAFVALCSPNYFLDGRCGREWWTFAERLRHHERFTNRQVPALIPVPWSSTVRPEDQPADSVGEVDEVCRLIRLRSLRPRYEAYLDSLAERIVGLVQDHDLPPLGSNHNQDSVPNAFEQSDPGGYPGIRLPELGRLGAATRQRVHFVVVAGSRAEMTQVRNDLQFYGERPKDWAPYRPGMRGPLAVHASDIAALRRFDAEIAELAELPGRIDQAGQNNEIVVLLVDSWFAKLPAPRQALAAFDARCEPTVAVLVPANGTDPETMRHRGELLADLDLAFHQNLARGDQLIRIEIDDTEAFETELVDVLEEAQNRIFRHGRVFRRPTEEPPTARPILQGP